MQINYISSEGVRITYDTGMDHDLTTEDLDQVARIYAQHHPDHLPSHAFMSLQVYGNFSRMVFKGFQMCHDPIDGHMCITLSTSVGILIIKPMPAMYNELNVVVGTERDLENILVDEVFEEIVLDGCERE